MALFKKNPIQRSKTLGERLRKVREESGFTLHDVEKGTRIRYKYIEAIEQGNYIELPGSVYIESFLKKYAEFLHVSSDYVLELYRKHEQRVLPKKGSVKELMDGKGAPKAIITPQLIRRLLLALIVTTGLIYLGIVVYRIFSPPNLIVSEPSNFITVNEASITVRGTTEPETLLKINGREVFLDSSGAFSETVTLNEGLNVINISAAKKRSKETVILRTVMYEFLKE